MPYLAHWPTGAVLSNLTRWRDSTPACLCGIIKSDVLAVISSLWSCQVRSCVSVTPSSGRVQFTCSCLLSFIVIGGMLGGVFLFLEAYVHLLRFVTVLCRSVGGSTL